MHKNHGEDVGDIQRRGKNKNEMENPMKQFTTGQISKAVEGSLDGDADIMIAGIEEISKASENEVTFIGTKKYARLWDRSQAPAAIVNADIDLVPGEGRALIRVPNADLAQAQILGMFAPEPPQCPPGVHAAATVDATAVLEEGVAVGAGCYIGPGVEIGARTRLYPNVTILDKSRIGSETVIWSGTVIRERCRIGSQCIIHPNVTIGADGFGFRPAPDGQGLVKIPQIGTVVIGDGVEIGAGSCVDRGKFKATIIGDGSKLDNHVQIAHNCILGRCVVMAAHCAIGGSVTVGDGVVMGGGTKTKDHITIGAGARLGGSSGAINDIPPGQTVLGLPADDLRKTLRIWAAQKQLPDLVKQVKKLAGSGKNG